MGKITKVQFTKVNHDVYGNPRYVCHFLNFITDKDKCSIDEKYTIAIKRAKQLGGRKYHNNQYGGGIVFQSYNIQETEKQIIELVNNL
jgi:hypothetical protein